MRRSLELPFLVLTGFLLTFLLTWPLIAKINTFYGDASDQALESWKLWYNQNAIVTGRIFDQEAYFNSNQFYPFPYSFAYSDHVFIPSLIFAPIYWLSNDLIFSANYFVILTFVFSFISAFYCLDFFVKDKRASLTGAFIFTFNPLTFSHFPQHLQLMNKFFLPPLFLFAYLYIKNLTWKNAFFFFLFFTLNALSSIYFFVFSLVLVPVFWLPFLITKLKEKNISFFFKFFLTGLVFLVFLPILFYFKWPYLQFSSLEGVSRTLKENSSFSARGIDWISSLKTSLLYENVTRELDFFREPKDINGFFNYSEHTLFINLLPFVLFLIGLFIVRRGTVFFAFALVVLFSAVFTFGPYFYGWNGKKAIANTFYYQLYDISVALQGIRVPTRFQFIFYFPFALIAAFGVKRLLESGKNISLVLFGLIWFFLLLENINKTNFNSTSSVLNYINSGKPFVINLLSKKNTLHFPLYIAGGFRNVGYLNWSTQTGETIINGYSGSSASDWISFADKVKGLDKLSLERLFVIGVDYLVIHKDLIGKENEKEYESNKNFLHQGLVYNDEKIEVVDIKKFQFQTPVCMVRDLKFDIQSKSYPVAQSFGTTFQLFSKITLINPKNCYIVSKYYDRYSKVELITKGKKQTIPIKLPVLIEPFEKIKIN